MLANRQTDRQTDRRGHHDTSQQLSSRQNPVRSVRAGATHAKSGQSDFADDSRRALRSLRSGRSQFPALSSPTFLAFHTNLAPGTDVTLVSLLSTHKHNCSRRAAHLQTDAGHYFQLLSATSILDATLLLHVSSRAFTDECIRYDTRDATLTCDRKPTRVSLIYRTEPTTKKCKTEKLKSKNGYPQK